MVLEIFVGFALLCNHPLFFSQVIEYRKFILDYSFAGLRLRRKKAPLLVESKSGAFFLRSLSPANE